MPVNLTRKELFDLVWATPRTAIAKQLGISAVRLGKVCREMNVPAPPRGYWANMAGARKKRRYVKPSLTYNLAERIEEDHATVWASFPDFNPKDFDQPIPPPPVISYSPDEAIDRYRRVLDQAHMPKATRGLHPITQKFVAEDQRLTKLQHQFSWEKPKFGSPEGQRLLQGLNQLLWMWTDLGFKPRASGSRDINMWIRHGGFGRSFGVTCASPQDARGKSPAKRGTTRFEFWFDTQTWERQSKKPALVFAAFSRAVLRSIAVLAIEHWEEGFRESLKRRYEWMVSERNEAIELAELARERDRQKKAAALQALLDSRQSLLQNVISSVARSDQIRSLVQALNQRIGQQTGEVPAFEHWRSWALSEAEAMDLRARSLPQLNEWFEKFPLDC